MSLGKNGFGSAKRERERDWSNEGDASSSNTSAGPHGDSPYKDDVSVTLFTVETSVLMSIIAISCH